MHKFTLTLWTDEMVFTRSAIQEQLDRYSQGWRRTFINYDTGIAEVYLPAIRSCQRMLEQIDKVMPPIKD